MSKLTATEAAYPFAIAGPWELAAEVHDRMPVILDANDYDRWLAGEQIPLIPFPADRMTAKPVSAYVNKAGNEGEQCVASPFH